MIGALKSSFARVRRAAKRALAAHRLRTRLVIFYGGFYLLTLLGSVLVLAPTLASLVEHQARTDVETAGIVLDRLWSMRGEDLQRSAEVASLDFGFREAIATRDRATIISALDNARSRLEIQGAYFLEVDGGVFESRAGAGRAGTLEAADDLFELVDGSDHTSGVIEIGSQAYHGAFAPIMAPDFRGWFVIVEPLDTRQLQASADLASLPITLAVVAAATGGPERSVEWTNWSLVLLRQMDAIGPADDRGYALVVSYPLAQAFAPYVRPLTVIAAVAILATLAFLWACGFLAQMFTGPIATLTDAASRLEAGEGSAVSVEGNDEIASLGRVFNSMSAEILSRERDLRVLLAEQSRLHDEAVRSNRAKSEFLATMSHELRTPLNAIIGYSEIIREDIARGSQEGVDADASHVLQAARHLLKLINDVLDFAKIEAHGVEADVEAFDFEPLVLDVVAMMHAAARANDVVVSVNLEGDLGVAHTDEFRIKQCLLNLLSNAIKFSGGGRVAVTARRTAWGGGERLVLEVSDTGIGMTREQLDSVFEPFVQAEASTTRRFGGTGLGLSIVRGLAEALGGDVSATSVLGQGSVFTLTVPARLDGAGTCTGARTSVRPHAAIC